MTNEELLKTRIKCIAPFLGMEREGFEVDVIFEPSEAAECSYPRLYPANFKFLGWWEERKPEDMPKWLREKSTGNIVEVERHCIGGDARNWCKTRAHGQQLYKSFEPATEEEFLKQGT